MSPAYHPAQDRFWRVSWRYRRALRRYEQIDGDPPPHIDSFVRGDQLASFAERVWWRLRRFPARLHPGSSYYPRTATYSSELMAIIGWGVLCILALAGLGAFGSLVGEAKIAAKHGFSFDSLGHTVQQPAVAVPLAFILLTLAGWFLRGAVLAWKTWRPGSIVVSDFTAAGQIHDATPA